LRAHPKANEAVHQAAQVDRDGAAFFRRANRLAADPRVKFIFGRAAEEYERALKSLEGLLSAKGKANVPAIFPFAEYERIECYVCGFEAKADELPEVCPSCGAARYAFEREVTQDRAWALVERTAKDALAFTRKLAAEAKPEAREAFAKAAEIRKRLLAEARQEKVRVAARP
jgi:hypothetical protein